VGSSIWCFPSLHVVPSGTKRLIPDHPVEAHREFSHLTARVNDYATRVIHLVGGILARVGLEEILAKLGYCAVCHAVLHSTLASSALETAAPSVTSQFPSTGH
jgi:hypothetical protein